MQKPVRQVKEDTKRISERQPKMTFLESPYRHIIDTVGYHTPECGGILLGYRKDYIVRKFIFDRNGMKSGGSYDPDVTYLNKVIKKEWEENGLELVGFAHSHPRGVSRLSGDWGNGIGDLGYIKSIFNAIPALPKFLVPIVFSEADGQELQILPFIAHRESPESYEIAQLEIIDESKKKEDSKNSFPEFVPNLQRLQGAVDTRLLAGAHIVCIGVGGANGVCENLVRTGLGSITVVDFDSVDENNLVTQGFYATDIGKSKVDALKERLLQINPKLKYSGITGDFTKMNQGELKLLIEGADILLMMTDNFQAQAKGNKLALKYGKPAVFAMMYDKARCSEITFTIPGVTPACHRCAVSSRYAAYANGYQNDVTSTGSTIFHTQYLNSAIGLLTLAILHRDTEGFEFSNWFGSRWERNLVQLRTHPSYSVEEGKLFHRLFHDTKQVFTFDSVWQKIEPEGIEIKGEPCPDCGGIGDLRASSTFISLLQNSSFRKSDWLKAEEV